MRWLNWKVDGGWQRWLCFSRNPWRKCDTRQKASWLVRNVNYARRHRAVTAILIYQRLLFPVRQPKPCNCDISGRGLIVPRLMRPNCTSEVEFQVDVGVWTEIQFQVFTMKCQYWFVTGFIKFITDRIAENILFIALNDNYIVKVNVDHQYCISSSESL